MTREQIIEAMARASCQGTFERLGACYDECEKTGKCCGADIDMYAAAYALTALETAIPGLADVIEGRAVVVPREPSAAMFTAGQKAVASMDPKAVRTVDWEQVYRAMIEAGKAGE